MPRLEATVTACIPYHGGQRYILRAVGSLLAQTHRALQIVVVNDGDTQPPWDQLASLRDPRLICFNLTRNHGGPFFANAVVVNAVATPWFLVQEQDDWSDPRRVRQLLDRASAGNADVALSAQQFHRENADGSSTPLYVRWRHTGRGVCPACPRSPRCGECFVDTAITSEYRYRAPHAGLFRVDLLRRIGGYYAGLDLHFDSLLMNLLLMTGIVTHTSAPLYHRLLRMDSITHSAATGFGSSVSNEERNTVRALYTKCFAEYQRYLRGQIDSRQLTESIRRHCHARLTASDTQELAYETSRLRSHLAAHETLN
jgi:glycosyltransferase involved in cell wall biosynthesis